jgi:hypothetical protein
MVLTMWPPCIRKLNAKDSKVLSKVFILVLTMWPSANTGHIGPRLFGSWFYVKAIWSCVKPPRGIMV